MEQVRELTRHRVECSSLRVVAEEIGLSAESTVHAFIRGSTPRRRTWAAFERWFRCQVDAGARLEAEVEYRTVTLQEMRAFYREIGAVDGVNLVAEAAGVGRASLHQFLRGSRPHPSTRRGLAQYFLREQREGDAARAALRSGRRMPKRRGRPGAKLQCVLGAEGRIPE